MSRLTSVCTVRILANQDVNRQPIPTDRQVENHSDPPELHQHGRPIHQLPKKCQKAEFDANDRQPGCHEASHREPLQAVRSLNKVRRWNKGYAVEKAFHHVHCIHDLVDGCYRADLAAGAEEDKGVVPGELPLNAEADVEASADSEESRGEEGKIRCLWSRSLPLCLEP